MWRKVRITRWMKPSIRKEVRTLATQCNAVGIGGTSNIWGREADRKGAKMYKRLREIREEHFLTCEQMAKLMGLQTKAGYNKKENGRTKFTLQDAKRVSEIFGMSIEDIFFADEASSQEISSA